MSPRKKAMFIINPISGVVKKQNVPAQVAEYLDFVQFDYTIRHTQYAGHAAEIAAQAVKDGYDVVVAVGGDGSINEVARSLVHTDTALGIIPYGSGNGLATHLGLEPRNIRHAIEVLNSGKEVYIDAIKTNLGHVFSCAGFGLDSMVARRFRHHGIRGFLSYAWAVVKELLFYFKPIEATVEIDGLEVKQEFFLFTAFNANQYGYNFGVFSFTSLHDGLMDVIVMKGFSMWKLFYIVACLMLKRPDLIAEAESYRARKIKIHGNRKMVLQFDGDPLIHHEDLSMEIDPHALKVIVPRTLNSY